MTASTGIGPWWQRQSAWLRVVYLIAAMAAVSGVFVLLSSGEEDKPIRRDTERYEADRAFCEERATDQAEATDGLHSVGGNWWVDRVNECLIERD